MATPEERLETSHRAKGSSTSSKRSRPSQARIGEHSPSSLSRHLRAAAARRAGALAQARNDEDHPRRPTAVRDDLVVSLAIEHLVGEDQPHLRKRRAARCGSGQLGAGPGDLTGEWPEKLALPVDEGRTALDDSIAKGRRKAFPRRLVAGPLQSRARSPHTVGRFRPDLTDLEAVGAAAAALHDRWAYSASRRPKSGESASGKCRSEAARRTSPSGSVVSQDGSNSASSTKSR